MFKIVLYTTKLSFEGPSQWFSDQVGLQLPLHVFLSFQQNNKIRSFLESKS